MNADFTKQFVEEIVKETQADFEARRLMRRPLELVWRLNMNFLTGNQYTSITPRGDIEDYGRQYYWQQREVFNHIAPIVETRIAKLSRVRSGVSVRPKTSDESDIAAAKFATAILASITAENNLTKLLATANGWSETCGTVFYKVMWDKEKGGKMECDNLTVNEGDVEITVCPPFEIYPENLQVEEIGDQRSIIHAKVYGVDEVKRIWGEDVIGGSVNVFTLERTNVAGCFGFSNTVPKIVDELRENCVVVIEKYEKPTVEFPEGRLIIVAGDKLLYYGALPYENGEEGARVYPFVKQNSLDTVGTFFGRRSLNVRFRCSAPTTQSKIASTNI
jgi:hypothetical protein